MWVADMDFASPEPVIRALHERVEHGVFGYGVEPKELRDLLDGRLQASTAGSVRREAIVFIPGVVTGFNLACRAVARRATASCIRRPSTRPSCASRTTPA